MKRNTREKALRNIISSILTSDLTANDIRALSDSITRGDDFAWELGSLLKEISYKLDKYAPNLVRSNLYDDNVSSFLHDAMNIVKSKRLSKTKILNFISKIDPNDHLLTERKITTNDLLADFFNRRPTKDVSELLRMLETSGRVTDDYLQGIMKKK